MSTSRRARRLPGPPLLVDAALLLPALAAGIGLARLGTAPSAWGVVAPVGLSAVAGHGVVSVVGRRFGRVAGALCGLVGVALVCAWWFFPAKTVWGVPTGATARAAAQALRQAWALIRAEPTPVQAVPAIALCMSLGAGLAAVCSRSLLVVPSPSLRRARWVRPVLALVPTAVLFGYASLLDSGSDRPQAALAYVVAVALFIAALEHPWSQAPALGASVVAPRRRRVGNLPLLFAGGLATAVVVPLLVVPSLSSMRPRPFVTSAGGGIGVAPRLAGLSGAIDAISLVDDVGAVLSERPDQLLFVARSPVATYWQVATLTTYDEGRWLADPETAAAADVTPLPGVQVPQLPQPAGVSFYDASVTVNDLQSELLPVPPAAVSVTASGAGATAQLVPGLGARLVSGSSFGVTYRVRSVLQSRPAARQPRRADLAPYLQLPQVSPEVVALTRRVVAGAPDPLAKARALTDFFARGGFRYSLSAEVPGPDPLVGFLFETKAGFCQQFAGAYGVMARLAGLPTRIAVGFTSGAPASGSYRVTGADAHVWPEVYLGRSLGWVSVDPTPPSPGVVTAPAPSVLVASTPVGLSAGPPVARLAPHGSTPPGASTAPAPPVTDTGRAQAAKAAHGNSWPWWVAGACVLVLCAALILRRRIAALLRRAGWHRLPPRRAVLAMWQDAAGSMGRFRHETPLEHAERVSHSFSSDCSEPDSAFVELAHLAAWAGYSGEEVTTGHCAAARRLHAGATRR